MTAVVEAESLTKRFGEVSAVTELSFALRAVHSAPSAVAILTTVLAAIGQYEFCGARRWSPSQPEDEVAYGRRPGEERVVAGVEFHDAARASGKVALQVGGGASVFDADEVGRGCVLPGR